MAARTFTRVCQTELILIHLPIIIFLQYLLIGVAIDPLIKFAIVGAVGFPLTFAISHYGIRQLPNVKYVLG